MVAVVVVVCPVSDALLRLQHEISLHEGFFLLATLMETLVALHARAGVLVVGQAAAASSQHS